MTERSQRRNLLICLCLTASVAAVYWPVHQYGFLSYDDHEYVSENQRVLGGLTRESLVWALTAHYSANWHPLTWVSLMLDHQWFGMWAGGYHLVNVLLHATSTWLLFAVFHRMTAAPWRSALLAALFALHPLHVELVAWVAERKDVLCALFWMLTLWAYVRYVEQFTVRGTRLKVFYGLALLFFALGLMAKPMVVTLPFVLLLLDYWPLGRTQWAQSAAGENIKVAPSQLLREKLPFFVLVAASCVATCWAQRAAGAVVSLEGVPLGTRVANAVLSYLSYLGKAFWPTSLAVFYPLDSNLSLTVAMIAGVGLMGATTAVIWRSRREPWLATGWFWYLGTLVPVIGLVQVGSQSMADRYTYLPLIGVFIMLCWSVPGRALERRGLNVAIGIAVVAAVAVCAVLTRIQVGYWRNEETLFRHALDVTRDNWVAHNNLGVALEYVGRVDEALGHYEQVVRIVPNFANGHEHLAEVLARLGRVPEAIEHYEQALRIRPDYAEAHCSLGITLARSGRTTDAIREFEQAVRYKPDYAEAHCSLGVALAALGRTPEAISQFEQAVRYKPDYAEAFNNLGTVWWRAGRVAEAIRCYEQALRINPGNVEAHYNLGGALEQMGRIPGAIAQYQEALRLKPGFPEAQNRLARLRAAQ